MSGRVIACLRITLRTRPNQHRMDVREQQNPDDYASVDDCQATRKLELR
jgi:hypothetical protein